MAERIMMPFEDWREKLLSSMEKHKMDEDDLRIEFIDNDDVLVFRQELAEFIRNSRNSQVVVR
jgi:hypothetical protein